MTTGIEISTDPARIDVALVHRVLSSSYWAKDRPVEVVEKSIRNSLCFGAYSNGAQIGFARLITDRAVFAYLADVFVVPEFGGRGVAAALLGKILEHPDIRGLKLIRLATRDARGLYEQFGFRDAADSDNAMELFANETGD